VGRLFIVVVNWEGGGYIYFSYFFIKHLATKRKRISNVLDQLHFTAVPSPVLGINVMGHGELTSRKYCSSFC
jgi:hypothetical protein